MLSARIVPSIVKTRYVSVSPPTVAALVTDNVGYAVRGVDDTAADLGGHRRLPESGRSVALCEPCSVGLVTVMTCRPGTSTARSDRATTPAT